MRGDAEWRIGPAIARIGAAPLDDLEDEALAEGRRVELEELAAVIAVVEDLRRAQPVGQFGLEPDYAFLQNGPLAVRVSKQIMRESRGWSMEERYDRQAQLIGPVFVSQDAREGSLAFAEKRKPNWTGK